MSQNVIAEWTAKEYEHKPRSSDWFWALSIIALACVSAALLFGNYLFALLICIAAGVLALHAAKEPPIHRFRLVENGLMIGDDLHPFTTMTSFSVLEDIEGEFPPMLSIQTESWHSPHLVISLEGVDADKVYTYFLHHVEEHEHRHTFNDVVAAWLGF